MVVLREYRLLCLSAFSHLKLFTAFFCFDSDSFPGLFISWCISVFPGRLAHFLVGWRKGIATGARALGFDFWLGQIGRSASTAATYIRSCVAAALSRGDGPCHWLCCITASMKVLIFNLISFPLLQMLSSTNIHMQYVKV